jgi:Tfp pilus assembly protein PilX
MIKRLNERGMMMVSILVIATVLTLIGFSLMSLTSSQYAISNRKVYSSNALMVAEAGVEQTLLQLNTSSSFAGYSTAQVFFDNPTQGRGEFTTTITDSTNGAKIITASGKVYRHGKNTVVSERQVKVTVVGTGSPGYSVHSGPGGLILGGSAAITNSSVYVNGGITMTGASKIGSYSQPLDVYVANMRCPTNNNPGPTYPQVCASGQPISTAWSTNIYGTVCATGQTANNNGSGNPAGNILPGSTGTGLVLGCIAPPVSPPTYDRAAHLAGVTTTAASNSNTYTCQSWPFNRTWPNGLRLNGNVSIASSCNVTITGDAYITGNLNIGGAATITVSNSVGANRPVVMVDGTITVGGSAQIIANSSGTGIQFISMKSNASCNPNCTTLTGNDLKNSQNALTVDVGGAVNLPGMIFQAYWGRARLAGSGSVGSIIGQTVDLSGAGTVTFGTALGSGESTWTVSSYQQSFPD